MPAPPAPHVIPLKEINDEHSILKENDLADACQWTWNSQGSHPLVSLLEDEKKKQDKGWLVCKGPPQQKISAEEKGYLQKLGSEIPESVEGKLKTLLMFAWGSSSTTIKTYLGIPLPDPGLNDELLYYRRQAEAQSAKAIGPPQIYNCQAPESRQALLDA
jgi:hypothetical protein